MDAIIVSLIGLAGSAIGSILGVLASARLTSYRLEQLEKRVQAHNNLIERMYQVEERTELQEEDNGVFDKNTAADRFSIRRRADLFEN